MVNSIDYIRDCGYLAARQLPNGTWVALLGMMFTTALCVGLNQQGLYKRRYCYERKSEAVDALVNWNGEGDPPGNWIKEKPSNRLNPNWVKS